MWYRWDAVNYLNICRNGYEYLPPPNYSTAAFMPLLPACMALFKVLGGDVLLGAGFIVYGWLLWRDYSEALARKTFRFSIWHLSLLFAALLIDHYLMPWY